MQNHSKLFPVSGGVPHLELRPGSSLESLYIRVCVHVCVCVCVCVCVLGVGVGRSKAWAGDGA